jgi:hypothetical protein
MLSSLLRPKKAQRVQHSPFSSPYVDQSSPAVVRRQRMARHASADFTETEQGDEDTEDDQEEEEEEQEEEEEDGEHSEGELEGEDNEDGEADTPLLPIFSAAHLGRFSCFVHSS